MNYFSLAKNTPKTPSQIVPTDKIDAPSIPSLDEIINQKYSKTAADNIDERLNEAKKDTARILLTSQKVFDKYKESLLQNAQKAFGEDR
ncbi:hypothetical protein SNEBB_010202 [Seison nebaliae]|nr:hypothetical protein SNEBB_010202 [Seison nebaliae]